MTLGWEDYCIIRLTGLLSDGGGIGLWLEFVAEGDAVFEWGLLVV